MTFWKKTPQDLRRKRLAEIERQRISQHEHLDYHYAMVAMQDEQIARLKEEIAAEQPAVEWKAPPVGVLRSALHKIRGDLEAVTNG